MEECRQSPIKRTFQEIGHNAIIYQYPDGSFDLIARSNGWFTGPGWEDHVDKPVEKRVREKGVRSSGTDMKRSMQRARAKVRRMALANDFRWFVTLTLDGAKIDRYNPEVIAKALSRWCDNRVRRHGLKYILVPELHKKGGIHFHGFFNDAVEAVDSGHTDAAGHRAYNLPEWDLGFTTAIELYGDYSAAVGYVCKYIGKQNGQRPMGRWYYSGGALKQPDKQYLDVNYRDVTEKWNGAEYAIPGAKIAIVKGKGDKNGSNREVFDAEDAGSAVSGEPGRHSDAAVCCDAVQTGYADHQGAVSEGRAPVRQQCERGGAADAARVPERGIAPGGIARDCG